MKYLDGDGRLVHRHPRARLVKNTRTGNIYASVVAAARAHGVGEKTMHEWVRRPDRPFEFVPTTKVLDIRSGKVYGDIGVAARASGIDKRTMRTRCREPTSTWVTFRA
jgi:hypothetical protein